MAPAYRGRLLVNVKDTYTSITFLRVNRTDSDEYTLTMKSRNRERAKSKVKISVECKYEKEMNSSYVLCQIKLLSRVSRMRVPGY